MSFMDIEMNKDTESCSHVKSTHRKSRHSEQEEASLVNMTYKDLKVA